MNLFLLVPKAYKCTSPLKHPIPILYLFVYCLDLRLSHILWVPVVLADRMEFIEIFWHGTKIRSFTLAGTHCLHILYNWFILQE